MFFYQSPVVFRRAASLCKSCCCLTTFASPLVLLHLLQTVSGRFQIKLSTIFSPLQTAQGFFFFFALFSGLSLMKRTLEEAHSAHRYVLLKCVNSVVNYHSVGTKANGQVLLPVQYFSTQFWEAVSILLKKSQVGLMPSFPMMLINTLSNAPNTIFSSFPHCLKPLPPVLWGYFPQNWSASKLFFQALLFGEI